MNGRGWARVLGVAGALFASGCGSSVTLLGAEGSGSDSGEGGAGTEPCVEVPAPMPAEVAMRVDEAATLIEGRLHFTGSVDGEEGYFVPRLEDGVLWFDAEPLAIEGPARWAAWSGGAWGRVVGGDGTTSLRAERLEGDAVAALPLEGEVPQGYRGTFSSFSDRLVFCHRAFAGAEMRLVGVASDGSLQTVAAGGCSDFYDASAAHGALFVSWTLGTGISGGNTKVVNLAEGGDTVVSFGFAPSGVHDYGGINGAGTDGAVAVVSTDNDDWMLVFDEQGQTSLDGPYVAFSPAGPKRLLAVLDAWAYFATPEGVVAYDLSDVAVPAIVEDRAEADWDPATLTFLTASEDRLFVRDGDGQLWSVPRRLDGPVAPTSAYAGEPVALPEGCLE